MLMSLMLEGRGRERREGPLRCRSLMLPSQQISRRLQRNLRLQPSEPYIMIVHHTHTDTRAHIHTCAPSRTRTNTRTEANIMYVQTHTHTHTHAVHTCMYVYYPCGRTHSDTKTFAPRDTHTLTHKPMCTHIHTTPSLTTQSYHTCT